MDNIRSQSSWGFRWRPKNIQQTCLQTPWWRWNNAPPFQNSLKGRKSWGSGWLVSLCFTAPKKCSNGPVLDSKSPEHICIMLVLCFALGAAQPSLNYILYFATLAHWCCFGGPLGLRWRSFQTATKREMRAATHEKCESCQSTTRSN